MVKLRNLEEATPVPLTAALFTEQWNPVRASQAVLVVKNPPASAGDIRHVSSVPGSGQSPGEGNGNPFQYPCLENAHGQRSLVDYSPRVTKTRIRLTQLGILKHGLSSSTQMSMLKTGLITE